jgi:transposase
LRQKKNKSGSISVQLIDKSSGTYRLLRTIGCAKDNIGVQKLLEEGERQIVSLTGQSPLNFEIDREEALIEMFVSGLGKMRLVGPELIIGKIFDEIGFNRVSAPLFRTLVLTRLVYPGSKLKTIDYVSRSGGARIPIDRIYRFMDTYHKKHMQTVQQISYEHTVSVLGCAIKVVFYDVTTLYFEAEQPDDLRKTGFSKDGKHSQPQIVLGLLVSEGGYPLAFDIFDGSKYEGHTLIPIINSFKVKYGLSDLTVVADAGLLSKQNISDLMAGGYKFILGGRPRNESEKIKGQILSLNIKNGASYELEVSNERRIIVSYSEKRAKKDAKNREKGLEKLKKGIVSGKFTKKNINNRGYNKYLHLEGEMTVSIDQIKYDDDGKWDGIKTYITNSQLAKEEIIDQYRNLWKIEKAFRISKSDLKIRPVYHRLKSRIEAHISIAFCAYKVYKEIERQLIEGNSTVSVEKAIEIVSTIHEIEFLTPYSKSKMKKLLVQHLDQQKLLEFFGILV